MNTMRKIKTFEEACKLLGYKSAIPNFSDAPGKHKKALEAHYKLIIITEAVNDGWQPNWSNRSEGKYQLWPDIYEDNTKPSGFGLSYYVCDGWCTYTFIGSRLCFRSRGAARYCFETFKTLWEDYFLIDK